MAKNAIKMGIDFWKLHFLIYVSYGPIYVKKIADLCKITCVWTIKNVRKWQKFCKNAKKVAHKNCSFFRFVK